MKDRIKEKIKEAKKMKTQSVSLTLSRTSLFKVKNEMERLDVKSRSFMVEMIIDNYFESK